MKVDAKGNFRAISVPPTLKWKPALAEERALLIGLDNAIESNPYISSERKQFLIRRLHYWNKWAMGGNRGIISTGDEE
jgi:hypothetical protein